LLLLLWLLLLLVVLLLLLRMAMILLLVLILTMLLVLRLLFVQRLLLALVLFKLLLGWLIKAVFTKRLGAGAEHRCCPDKLLQACMEDLNSVRPG
jgi:hypothetical protein